MQPPSQKSFILRTTVFCLGFPKFSSFLLPVGKSRDQGLAEGGGGREVCLHHPREDAEPPGESGHNGTPLSPPYLHRRPSLVKESVGLLGVPLQPSSSSTREKETQQRSVFRDIPRAGHRNMCYSGA
ncbi:hypothetical protein DPEC_G00320240 [Dallia pectoralis]|uniref:Uncharacterized protein n=1 Tax=Dallia pectoralis TaxID=75939 RepID=A0ACC2F9T6_DALPE|nr:hypothetical protein DPEC_G00320240 [Dallia pectoralis]